MSKTMYMVISFDMEDGGIRSSAFFSNSTASVSKSMTKACLAMVRQLMLSASKRWRLLNGSELLPDVIQGVVFQDGLRLDQAAA